jgi:hypothetical protein
VQPGGCRVAASSTGLQLAAANKVRFPSARCCRCRAGTSVTHRGRPLINPGGNQPLYFAEPGSNQTGEPINFKKFPGAPLEPDSPLNIVNRLGVPVRNDNTTTPAYLGSGSGSSYPEQYAVVDPANVTGVSPIMPGSPVLLKNKQTGTQL